MYIILRILFRSSFHMLPHLTGSSSAEIFDDNLFWLVCKLSNFHIFYNGVAQNYSIVPRLCYFLTFTSFLLLIFLLRSLFPLDEILFDLSDLISLLGLVGSSRNDVVSLLVHNCSSKSLVKEGGSNQKHFVKLKLRIYLKFSNLLSYSYFFPLKLFLGKKVLVFRIFLRHNCDFVIKFELLFILFSYLKKFIRSINVTWSLFVFLLIERSFMYCIVLSF